jgi:hypothetical protein
MSSARTYSSTSQGLWKQTTSIIGTCNFNFSHAVPVSNKVTKTIQANIARNTPLLPRVVTPMMGPAASPRVLARTQNLSPRNLSQDDFWSMETANQAIALGANHWTYKHSSYAVVQPVTGKKIEYMALMKDPDLQPLCKRGFINEAGQLFQGIRDISVTNTCFFVELKKYQRTEKSRMAKLSLTKSLTKKKNNAWYSQWAATGWINPVMWKLPLQISLHLIFWSIAHCQQKTLQWWWWTLNNIIGDTFTLIRIHAYVIIKISRRNCDQIQS